MPLSVERPLPAINHVVPGRRATLDLPPGNRRYLNLMIALTMGEAAASALTDILEWIVIKVDGREQRQILADQLEYLDEFNGEGYASFAYDGGTNLKQRFLHINFAEEWRRTADGEDALAWGTSGVKTLQVEFKIKSTFPAANLLFDGTMEVEYGDFRLGAIRKVAQYAVPATSEGRFNLSKLPTNLPLYRVHLFSDKVKSVRVILNGNVVREVTKAEQIAKQTKRGLNPRADIFTIDFDGRQRVGDSLNVVNADQFELEIEHLSGVQPYQCVYEQIGGAAQ